MTLNNHDTLLFPCDSSKPCLIPHFYHILYPHDTDVENYIKTSFSVFEKRQRLSNFNNKSFKRANWARYLADGIGQEKAVNLGEWTTNERD